MWKIAQAAHKMQGESNLAKHSSISVHSIISRVPSSNTYTPIAYHPIFPLSRTFLQHLSKYEPNKWIAMETQETTDAESMSENKSAGGTQSVRHHLWREMGR